MEDRLGQQTGADVNYLKFLISLLKINKYFKLFVDKALTLFAKVVPFLPNNFSVFCMGVCNLSKNYHKTQH